MSKYELMTMAHGSKGEDTAKKISLEIQKIITSLGGSLVDSNFWGKRKLSYKIKQETEGYYDVMVFEMDSAKIAEFKSKLNLIEALVRYLITAKS